MDLHDERSYAYAGSSPDAPQEIKEVYAILEIHSWSRKERLAYKKARIGLIDDLNAIDRARKEGIEEGKEEGLKEGMEKGGQEEKLEMAQSMLADKEPIGKIMRWTGLSK